MAIGKKATTKLVFVSLSLAVLMLSTAAKCGEKNICHPPPGANNTCPATPTKK